MRRATLDEFVSSPIGRWTHAPPLGLWVASPKLCGITYGGFVSDADLPRLRELAQLPFHPALERPYAALIDCSTLSGIDGPAFAFLVEHLRRLGASSTSLLSRVACIRAPGMTGAASIGLFHDHMDPNLALRFTSTLDEAIAFLNADAHREAILEVIDANASTNLVAALRGLLQENLRQSLPVIARRLGVSTRSLQRACTSAGSSYRDEVANARFAFAESLLIGTDDKVEAIARRAGYASGATLARRFLHVHGVSPTTYRKRRAG